MAFIDSTMTTVCVRSREHGQRARYANSGCLQAAHSTKLTQMATTCHLNLFTTIYCYSIVFFGFGASFADPQFVVLSIGSIYGAWPCVCVCVCLIFILFVWREQERDSMAILCDLWGESEENWTKHKSWLHSISFHNILTPSLCHSHVPRNLSSVCAASSSFKSYYFLKWLCVRLCQSASTE